MALLAIVTFWFRAGHQEPLRVANRATPPPATPQAQPRSLTDDELLSLFPDTPVAYAAGDRERPIHEQAPIAFRTLEASLPTLRGRR